MSEVICPTLMTRWRCVMQFFKGTDVKVSFCLQCKYSMFTVEHNLMTSCSNILIIIQRKVGNTCSKALFSQGFSTHSCQLLFMNKWPLATQRDAGDKCVKEISQQEHTCTWRTTILALSLQWFTSLIYFKLCSHTVS